MREAGEIQLSRWGSGFRVRKKGEIDLVTEVDLECEAMCRAMLARRFPDHQVWGEEQGLAGPPDADARWIFDPLDGTTNYAHGLPIYCSSLALEIGGTLQVGAIYDPTRREMFTAERGRGAYLNGLLIRPSAESSLIDALLVTGFPYSLHERSEELVGLFGAFLERARAVRRLGSAALDLCYVACGRFDGFWEQFLRPWDVAAGALIVQEAGGRMSGMDGSAFSVTAGHLIASNGMLHDHLVDVITSFRATRSNPQGHTAR